MSRIYFKYILVLLGSFVLVQSCKQEPVDNPFDDVRDPQDTVRFDLLDPEPNTIADLYVNIFKPTCSNVGCHDGTFEPDFRTLESSYNTLVNRIPIKNDGTFPFRVTPGQPNQSVIMARLNGTITPLMPFAVEPDSDWPAKKDDYINRIRTWIQNGARDISGASPGSNFIAPRIAGAAASQGGNWLTRTNANGPIRLQTTDTEIELFFAFSHDTADPLQFGHNKIAFATEINEFPSTVEFDLQKLSTPFNYIGYHGVQVRYTHKITINPESLLSNKDKLFFRTYVSEGSNPVIEIPNEYGIFYLKTYMSISVVD
jgi:hypothetical protein